MTKDDGSQDASWLQKAPQKQSNAVLLCRPPSGFCVFNSILSVIPFVLWKGIFGQYARNVQELFFS